MQAVVAEHMRHEFERLEYFREGRIADAQAAGVGAEGGHHRALAIGGKAAPLHRTAARGDARLGMKVTGDLAARGRSMERRCFACDGERAVMPAFGAYAGGLSIRDAAFAKVFGAGHFTAHLLGDNRVHAIAASRCS